MSVKYKLLPSSPPPTFKRFVKRVIGMDLFVGLKITLLELFRPKTIATIKYPLEKIPLSPRYRAVHKLMRLLESGNERCIGCGLCEKICVSNCIKIDTFYCVNKPDSKNLAKSLESKDSTNCNLSGRKDIKSYSINFGRCIYCGLCAEVCPELAIVHGARYENVSYQRAHFKLKDDLLTPIDLAKSGNIDEYSGYGSISQNADANIKQTPLGY